MAENYTIKEGYELPSKGLIYDKPINAVVELRSMTTRDEMKRLSPTKTPYKLLSEIIEDCMIIKPDIHVYDMCIGDYEYLLHKLRVVTYGPEYKILVQCPSCGAVNEQVIDLDSLKVLEFDADEFKSLQTVHLPKSDKTVTLKIQTPRMLDDIELRKEEFKKKNKDVTIDPTLMITLQLVIDTVDGVKMSYTDLESFINKLPAKDTNVILNTMKKMNGKVGLDTTFEVPCDQCGFDVLTFFRFTSEFFRPTED